MNKLCKICGSFKDALTFHGKVCRECNAAKNKTYRENNREKILKSKREYYQKNKEKSDSNTKKWLEKHKQEYTTWKKQYEIDNKEKIGAQRKVYTLEHKKEKQAYDKEYRKKNKDMLRIKQNEKVKKRRKTDIQYKIKTSISSAIRNHLKKMGMSKNNSCVKFLPYTIEELKLHLESLFELWMTWENNGKYNIDMWNDSDPSTWTWQIDHIMPHSDFYYETMDCQEFRDCWALSNLRPLSAKQNWLDGINKARHSR